MARRFKFPDPRTCQIKDRAVMCDAERILNIYNQATGEDRKRITNTIKEWFLAEADKVGWAGGRFLVDAQSGHGAGCVLFVPPQQVNVSIKVTKNMLILTGEKE